MDKIDIVDKGWPKTNRGLAIEQWEVIRSRLNSADDKEDVHIPTLKRRFCVNNNVRWPADCLFCEMYRTGYGTCGRCPLCRGGSSCYENGMLYHDVMNARNPVGMRIAAAERMIKEYKDFKVREGL